jgi:hypothetical protein
VTPRRMRNVPQVVERLTHRGYPVARAWGLVERALNEHPRLEHDLDGLFHASLEIDRQDVEAGDVEAIPHRSTPFWGCVGCLVAASIMGLSAWFVGWVIMTLWDLIVGG